MTGGAFAPRRRASGTGPPRLPEGGAANDPTDNVIDHWFGGTDRPWRSPFAPGSPANEPSGPGADVINPFAGEPPSASPKFPEGFDPSPGSGEPVKPFDIEGQLGPRDPLIDPFTSEPLPGMAGVLPLAVEALIKEGQSIPQQDPYNPADFNIADLPGYTPPGGTQGAETPTDQPADVTTTTEGDFTDWGGYQMPGDTTGQGGNESGGAWMDSGSGGAFAPDTSGASDASGGSDWYGGGVSDYGGGGGGGGYHTVIQEEN